MFEERAENVVVVAVRAEREVSKAALGWALTHVVRPGDLVTLLAVLSDQDGKPCWRRRLFWGFPRLNGDSGSQRRERCQISASCSQMALQIDGRHEINVRIKVVGGSSSSSRSASGGVVAAESKSAGANWVVLDKQLKHEEKLCMEQLQCNIVVMKGSSAKVLRLNLGGGGPVPHKSCPPFSASSSYSPSSCSEKIPDHDRLVKASSVFVGERNPLYEGSSIHGNLSSKEDIVGSDDAPTSDSDGSGGIISPADTNLGLDFRRDGAPHRWDSTSCFQYPSPSAAAAAHNNGVYHWIPQNHISGGKAEVPSVQSFKNNHSTRPPISSTTRTLQDKFSQGDRESIYRKLLGLQPTPVEDYTAAYSSGVREAISLFGSSPSIPPPLCSFCRHKAPVFGKPPRRFTYQELEEATNGFSYENFVADGGFGCVHRGVLEDGQVVAVKRLKPVADGDPRRGDNEEFREQVEVLSRAQHRNVVMLVGFCVEGKRPRVLVYEFICNGSLDLHLYGREKPALDWHARIKIAIGVARGLRYLHEDCRVGFVVHKDMRPNNILLTHDFEPLVGDFSLTRWQAERSHSVDAQVSGTFGYLAPEYIEYGIVTEKADVYAFGVVLLELITGRRVMDMTQPKGQQFLVDWARPLLSLASEGRLLLLASERRPIAVDQFLDPCLDQDQAHFYSQQLRAMACAASLCLRRDPQARPSMSKVLKVLEGNNAFLDPGLDSNPVGSRSGRLGNPILHPDTTPGGSISLRFPHEAIINALYAERSWSHFS